MSQSTSIGFPGLLCVAFIVLKLTGTIAWSWWWVLAPLWMPVVIAVLVLLIVLILTAAFGMAMWNR